MLGRFGNLITAMVTPFDDQGKVDLDEIQKLAAALIESGSEGLVVTGSTGEAATLSDQERFDLWSVVVDAVGERGSVIAGTGTYDTAHSIHLTRQAEKAGVDAALVVTPYYVRPPQSGLVAHFKSIASSTALPVVLYDIPLRTARKIEHQTLVELASVENIVGVKDSCGDAQGAARLISETPEDFQIYCGNDGDALPWICLGAVGIISVASHVAGAQMAEMIRLLEQGDLPGARRIHLGLMPVFDILALTSNPIPVKAALEMIGRPVGSPRLPLVPATAGEQDRIRKVMSKAGLL